MDRFDRIYALHRILSGRRTPIPLKALQEKLECSRATANRCIEDARDFLNAPIRYDRVLNGYHYAGDDGRIYELPGLWFNSSELFALLVSHKLLAEVQPGLLEPHLAPLRERVNELLRHRRFGHPQIGRRIRILPMAARPANLEHFQKVATALLERRRLRILYHGRARDATTERDVSPQRLAWYRSNWYLDAWCHKKNGLRSFSLDRMHPVFIHDKSAREIEDETLSAHYASAYGIFAGKAKQTAVLRFTSDAAKWVSDEHWHPDQQGKVLENGGYELHIPYSNPTELIMDILKYGPDVEVIGPGGLRGAVRERLQQTLKNYE